MVHCKIVIKNEKFEIFFSSSQEQRLTAGKTMKGVPEDRPDNIESAIVVLFINIPVF